MTPPDSFCRKIWLHTALLRASVCQQTFFVWRLGSGRDATYELQREYFSNDPRSCQVSYPKSKSAETAPKGFDSSPFNLQIRIDIEGERETAKGLAEAGTTASHADQHEFPFLSNYSTYPPDTTELSDTSISKHMIGFPMATCSHGCRHCAAPSLLIFIQYDAGGCGTGCS